MAQATLPIGLEDDMRGHMFEATETGRPFALATIARADGGPRPVGAQMVVTEDHAWGFLSGGCIEADVSLHAREILATGEPRLLIYGDGSPFIDMRLPCGGRIDVLVERVPPDDQAVARLRTLTEARIPARWESDGRQRRCGTANDNETTLATAVARQIYAPIQRLAVIGSDPFAVAIAGLGTTIGWDTVLLTGANSPPPLSVRCDGRPLAQATKDIAPDPWTAIAVATHDFDIDLAMLTAALRSDAGYVGLLGSRRRLPKRLADLKQAGLDDATIARLRAPIGLPIGAQSPWEIAIAVIGEIIAQANNGARRSVRTTTDAG